MNMSPAGPGRAQGLATDYLRAGLNVVPVRTDGSKAPLLKRNELSHLFKNRMEKEVLESAFAAECGIGIVLGPVSVGGLVVLDFDDCSAFDEWREAIAKDLFSKLCVIQSPGGWHVYVRRDDPEGSRKLASRVLDDGSQVTRIELRGANSYILAPGCPPACNVNANGRTYQHSSGPQLTELAETPELTNDEYDQLVSHARALDEAGPRRATKESETQRSLDFESDGRPGSDFNQQADWKQLLLNEGWRFIRSVSQREFWQRPGKAKGDNSISATLTTMPDGSRLFYNFSQSAAPVDAGRCYTPFQFLACCSHGGDYSSAARSLRKQGFGSAASPEEDSRPIISIVGGDLSALVDSAEKAMLSNIQVERLFQRGGELVRVVRLSDGSSIRDEGLQRRSGSLTVLSLQKPERLIEILTECCRFERPQKNGARLVNCPGQVAKAYLSRAGHWRVPVLVGLVEAPTLRPDGSILQTPGYDLASGYYFDPGGLKFDEVPKEPTRDAALAALQELKVVLEGFPFVEPCDRSAAISAILTALIRLSLRSCPIFCYRAPSPASGKSLSADVVSLVATGRPAAAMPPVSSEDEWRKRIVSVLLAGDGVVVIDNIQDPLGSDALCIAITQQSFSDRLLGKNERVSLPSRTLWLATGNNLTLSGDLVTRAIPIDLDAGKEDPGERKFDVDLYELIPRRRKRLVTAGLTILRAFHVAGRPSQGLSSFGRFEDWSEWVRGACVWLGLEDPCLGRARLKEADPARAALRAVLISWEREYPPESGPATVSDVLREVSPRSLNMGGLSHGDLFAALLAVARERGGLVVNSIRLGKWLRKHEGVIEGGLRIVSGPTRDGSKTWWIERRGEPRN